jgi:hypothetical protein
MTRRQGEGRQGDGGQGEGRQGEGTNELWFAVNNLGSNL